MPVNTEVVKLTSFENEACNLTTVRGVSLRSPTNRTAEAFAQDVREYLGRPNVIDTGTFNQTIRSIVSTYVLNFSNVLAWIPNMGSRLIGALGIRCTLVLRVQVNANPFQAGRLRLCFNPEVSDRAEYFSRGGATLFSNPASQLPGVELDICESTSCMLRVPYIRHTEYIPLHDASGDTPVGSVSNQQWGVAWLYAYLPLTIAPSTPIPTYTTWLHLEDIEIVGVQGYPLTPLVPQAKDTLSKEEVRPITGALNAGSRAMTLLGFGIPAISSFTGTAAWALRAAANLASSFGWSKPTYLDAPTRMIVTTQTYQHNCDGFDATYNLGMFSDNHIVPLPGFAGTDVDEMAFAYILGQWAQIGYYTLSPSDLQGALKWGVPLTPRAMWFNEGPVLFPVNLAPTEAGQPPAVLTTPVFHLANVFNLWKGSFEFRIKIAKTKFHTGRLLLAYCPISGQHDITLTSGLLAPNIFNAPLDYPSAIWDLREGNEFTFCCPFVSQYSYLKVGTMLNDVQDYGNFYIYVLDPIQAPSTAATVVPFCVEVRCAPGFEFHQPCTPFLMPSPFNQNSYVSQSSCGPADTSNLSDAQNCIGEHIRSVKQMISRACLDIAGVSRAPTGVYGSGWPHWWAPLIPWPITVEGTTSYPLMPFCSYFLPMYAYVRGSTVRDFYVGGQRSGAGLQAMTPAPVYMTATMYPTYSDPGNQSCNPIIPEGNQLHVRLPYQQLVSRVLTFSTTYDGYPQNQFGIYGSSNNVDLYPSIGFIRAGDDSQLGFFLGSPPLDLPVFSPRFSEAAGIVAVKALTPISQ